ncbi:MAG TPA: alpha/beta fold hydrolase [Thermoanaerobaculia bacterium]|nr:alpha/beta fold hydrolase [Thermoanaerobaculia bacterium]
MAYSDATGRPGAGVVAGLVLAGAAVGLPVLVSEVIRRRAEPPQSPRWGRAHRYSGALGEIVFQELGAGAPPLLLLHSCGPGYDGNQWRAAAELLAGRHSVYVPDLPGWGRSEAPAGGHVPELYIRSISGFLDRVVRAPAVIVAAGLSAAYAVRIALDHPERVRGLVLAIPLGLAADATAFATPGAAFLRQLLQLPVVRATTLDLLTSRSALEHHLRREVYAAPERVDAALLDHHYRASHRPRARTALSALLRGDLWLEVESALDDVDVPVLLAWGRSAKAAPVESADLWLRRLPDARVEVFQGSADLPHVESAGAFCNAVERFLSELPA